MSALLERFGDERLLLDGDLEERAVPLGLYSEPVGCTTAERLSTSSLDELGTAALEGPLDRFLDLVCAWNHP